MSIRMAGIDHIRAEVDIRSRFAFTKREMEEAFALLQTRDQVLGSIIISTCNRTELWVSAEEGSDLEVKRLLCELKDLPYEQYEEYLYGIRDEDAVDHLFRLASGLESRILGEDQIVTQVKEALGKARESFATDHVLEVLFRQAVTAGKRVKTEVNLSTADRSVIHQAIRTLSREGFDVAGKRCMVIGNGMMGKLAASTLAKSGAKVTVTVRQYHSGRVEIPENCGRINYEERLRALPDCDMVVSATTSPNVTLKTEDLKAMRVDHDICLIDLAVPRDIEASAGGLAHFRLYDIDSFQVDLLSEDLRENIRRAEQILEEEKRGFFDYYEGRDLLPLIGRLKEEAARDIDARLTPVYHKEPLRGERERISPQVMAAASRMMNKLLFGLKDELDIDQFRACLQAMEKVWEQ